VGLEPFTAADPPYEQPMRADLTGGLETCTPKRVVASSLGSVPSFRAASPYPRRTGRARGI
jgi:hypothetical protein